MVENPASRVYSDVSLYLPPRREWARPDRRHRGGKGRPTVEVLRDSIYRKVQGIFRSGRIREYEWGRRLEDFIASVKNRVMERDFSFVRPELWLRSKAVPAGSAAKFRCISSYRNLSDRVVLALANKYLSSKLDPLLSDSCYAFRTVGRKTYTTAVRRLAEFRCAHSGRLYAADCDLKSFFDSVSHDVIRTTLRRLDADVSIDPVIFLLLEGYLSSYNLEYVRSCREQRARSERSWRSLCLPESDNPRSTGIAQGGALSGLLANLVLSTVDSAAVRPGVFYARYCDDMLFVAKTKRLCEEALKDALAKLRGLSVAVHTRKRNVLYGSEYYAMKSKGPYAWADPALSKVPCVPWVTFLGYAVKYDGGIRVRKESVMGHGVAIREECADFLERYERGECKPGCREAAVSALFYRVITKGIGWLRIRPSSRGFGRSWLTAFRLVGDSPDGLRQMCYLDRVRSRAFAFVLRRTGLRIGRDFEAVKEGEGTLYFGRPFSYFGAACQLIRDGVAKSRRLSVVCSDADLSKGMSARLNNGVDELGTKPVDGDCRTRDDDDADSDLDDHPKAYMKAWARHSGMG